MKTYPTQQYLREMFDYDPDAGTLKWRHRPAHHFSDPKTAERVNKSFEGLPVKLTKPTYNTSSYLKLTFQNKRTLYPISHLIWIWVHGTFPPGSHIRYYNGDNSDLRLENLDYRPPKPKGSETSTQTKSSKTRRPKPRPKPHPTDIITGVRHP